MGREKTPLKYCFIETTNLAVLPSASDDTSRSSAMLFRAFQWRLGLAGHSMPEPPSAA